MPYDESEAEPLTEPDTNNATKFYSSDASADFDGAKRLDGTATYEQHYTRLSMLNSGVYNGKWGDESARWKQEGLAIFDSISCQLELTSYQKQVGRQQFEAIDLPRITTAEIDTALVAIMVSAVVARRDGRLYHPNREDRNNDPLFVELIDSLNYNGSVLHSAYGKVLNQISV